MAALPRPMPKLHRPSKGYRGGPNTSPPRDPERLARRLAWIREHYPLPPDR